MTTAAEVAFWASVALLVYTQVGYGLLLAVLTRILPRVSRKPVAGDGAGTAEAGAVSLIIAAHNEAAVIGERVRNARGLVGPGDRPEVIVACDGCSDDTAELARRAGADRVLELPRGGKVRAQDAAVAVATGEIVAFSDANSRWEADALARLLEAFSDPAVGYACGHVRFQASSSATNQEGVYWRYEMGLRRLESDLASITAGNGAIYATRREAYMVVDPIMGHDLSFPFNMVKRGWRAVYVPDARATEKMVPTLEGEFARKRRMMSHTWPIVLRGGLASPRGYPALYALMIISHRLLRYASPALHVIALITSAILVRNSPVYAGALGLQLALLLAALLAVRWPARPLLLSRYYVLTTASIAAGLWDWGRRGTRAGWEAAEGTR